MSTDPRARSHCILLLTLVFKHEDFAPPFAEPVGDQSRAILDKLEDDP
jgi:hypothetical protein